MADAVANQQDRTFPRLWGALTVAMFGQQVVALALPLTAAVTLDASAAQMGLLAAASLLPYLLFSLPAGVMVDRTTRLRVLMVAADLGRALLLLAVPIMAWGNWLQYEFLLLVAVALGVMSVVFEVAHYAYVPMLIGRERLVWANSRFQVSFSVNSTVGPGVAGLLIQAFSAPTASLASTVSFLFSALLLRGMPASVANQSNRRARAGFRREMVDGLYGLLGQPLLRAIVRSAMVRGFFFADFQAIFLLYAVRKLGLSAGEIGLVLACSGVAAVAGGLLSERIAARIGMGWAIFLFWFLSGAAMFIVPLTGETATLPLLATGQAVYGFCWAVANVNQGSLRQIVTPDHLLGRVTASHRFTVYGAEAIGAVAGGLLASSIGLQPALIVFAAGATVAPLLLLLTPLPKLRAPTMAQATA